MRVKQIPPNLLPHTCEYYPVTLDDWDAEAKGNMITLTSVRFEPSSKRVLAKDGKEKQLTGLLFYDVKNSKPSGYTFKRGDIIRFAGEDYHIETIKPVTAFSGLHHHEIGLI